MRIEEGKKYHTRDGRVIGPIERVATPEGLPESEVWVWRARAEDGSWMHWTQDGHWFQHGDTSPMDLVKEWALPETEAGPGPASGPEPQLAASDMAEHAIYTMLSIFAPVLEKDGLFWVKLAGHAAAKAQAALASAVAATAEKPFVAWKSGKCPEAEGTRIEATLRNGETVSGEAQNFIWDWTGRPGDILSYRVVA